MISNSLAHGCDCLGHMKYFHGCGITADGTPILLQNVVCMHEVDAGVGWKHTNFRSGTSSVVRNRQLVIQCTANVANHEYISTIILDQAAYLHFEVRATGIVSTMAIRKNAKVRWGTTVAPGVLAVNHQHIFNIRIDPVLEGPRNTVAYEDAVAASSEDDPFGKRALAAGEFTNQSRKDTGLGIWVNRNYNFENEDVVFVAFI